MHLRSGRIAYVFLTRSLVVGKAAVMQLQTASGPVGATRDTVGAEETVTPTSVLHFSTFELLRLKTTVTMQFHQHFLPLAHGKNHIKGCKPRFPSGC